MDIDSRQHRKQKPFVFLHWTQHQDSLVTSDMSRQAAACENLKYTTKPYHRHDRRKYCTHKYISLSNALLLGVPVLALGRHIDYIQVFDRMTMIPGFDHHWLTNKMQLYLCLMGDH
jgi:hypothetical protein